MNGLLIVMWMLLFVMWCLALFGMYLRGQLDALAWTRALMTWKPPAPKPTDKPDWKHIFFYLAPLAVTTLVVAFLTVR